MRLTHTSSARSVGLLLGLSLLGCDPAQRDLVEAGHTAHKTSTDAHAALVKAVAADTASTDELGRPKACWDSFDYGEWMEDYLDAASEPDADAAGEALVTLNRRLRCVSAAEFATFQYAVFNNALINDDLLKTPELDAVEEELVPLVVMLHDMGGRTIAYDSVLWLNAHASLIEASLLKGHLSELGLFPAVYNNLRTATEDELALAADIIADGVTIDCSLSTLLNSGESDPHCGSDCVPVSSLTLDGKEITLPDPSEACQEEQALRDFAADEDLGELAVDCLEAYIEDTKSEDATVCIVTSLAEHVTDHSDMFDLTPHVEMRITDSCQVSERVLNGPGIGGENIDSWCEVPGADDSFGDWRNYAACLKGTHIALVAAGLEKDAAAQIEYELGLVEEFIDELTLKAKEEADTDDEGGEGEGGTENYCGPDDTACDESCGIDSYALNMLETCYTAESSGEIQTAPDPIDPLDPETDPDSALGQLEECLAEAAAKAAGDDGDSCDEALDCGEGIVAEEVAGTCQCPLDTRVPLDIIGCDEQIECSEDDGSCTCDGVPLEGNIIRDPASPLPDPTTLGRIGLPPSAGSDSAKE